MTTCKFGTTLPGNYSWSDEEEYICTRPADDSGFCPLHNPDPNKPTASFEEALKDACNIAKENDIEVINLAGTDFPREITRLPLEHLGEKLLTLDIRKASFPGKADFHDFLWKGDIRAQGLKVIDDLNFGKAEIGGYANFRNASIGGYASFTKVAIGGDADFYKAAIGGYAYFREMAIGGDARFSEAAIGGYADFYKAAIGGYADFSETAIGGDANFRETAIGGDANFRETAIGGDADFYKAAIGGDAYFRETAIGGYAYFRETAIGGYADFRETDIGGDADFRETAIGGYANFSETAIGGDANFSEAAIGGYADFYKAAIGGYADFSEADIEGYASFNSLFTFGTLYLSGFSAKGAIGLSTATARTFQCKAPGKTVPAVECRFGQCDILSSGGEEIRLTRCSPELKLPDNRDAIWNKRKTGWEKFKEILDTRDKELTVEHLMETAWRKNFDHESEIPENPVEAKKQFLEYFPLFKLLNLPNRKQAHKKIGKSLHKQIDLYQQFINKAESLSKKKQEWNFSNRDLSGLSFVECDLTKADFSSSYIGSAYFDNCHWGEKGESMLYRHNELLNRYKEEKTPKNKTELNKLKNVYQRFKKYFEENHDYRQAGDFHFREMEIRTYTDDIRWDRGVLWFYRWIAGYGENYLRVLLSMIAFLILLPFGSTLFSSASPTGFMDRYFAFFQYYFYSVIPRTVGKALGSEDVNAIQKSDQKVGADQAGNLDKIGEYIHDPATLGGLKKILGVTEGVWTEYLASSAIILSLIVFYAGFLTLTALFVMSVRRRYRR